MVKVESVKKFEKYNNSLGSYKICNDVDDCYEIIEHYYKNSDNNIITIPNLQIEKTEDMVKKLKK